MQVAAVQRRHQLQQEVHWQISLCWGVPRRSISPLVAAVAAVTAVAMCNMPEVQQQPWLAEHVVLGALLEQ